MPDDRLLDGIRVSGELVADRRPDEVGAIGVEALMHQQIDMTRSTNPTLIVIFSVSPDLPRSRLYFSDHDPSTDTIPMDGIWMVNQPIAIRNFEKKVKNRNLGFHEWSDNSIAMSGALIVCISR